jgi:molecular chaperone GrpE
MSRKRTGPVADLQAELGDAEVRCAEYRDAAMRAAADFENYRRRAQGEIADARRRGIETVMCDLVPVLDNFARALSAVGNDMSVESVRKGVVLIQRQLRAVLEAHGLREYSCVGEQFDPRRAEAIGFVASAEHQPETVVAEECCGYQCAERVVRPARVVVARRPEEKGPVDEETTSLESAGPLPE